MAAAAMSQLVGIEFVETARIVEVVRSSKNTVLMNECHCWACCVSWGHKCCLWQTYLVRCCDCCCCWCCSFHSAYPNNNASHKKVNGDCFDCKQTMAARVR